MNIMRARNGSYGMSEYEGIVSPAYCVYENIIPVDPRYMHYLLKTPQMVSLFEAFSYGICEHRRRLYAPDFLRISIPLPPVEEQKEIADFLEQERKGTEFAITKIKQQISLLKEYRTRLISDVVTGQKDVRDIVIPEYEAEANDIEADDTADLEDMESEVSSDE